MKFPPIPYDTLIHDLPLDIRPAWYAFASMAANKRKRGEISESVITALLQQIMLHCKGMPDAAIAHGLLEAVKGNADNFTYVLKAATTYCERAEIAWTPPVKAAPVVEPPAPLFELEPPREIGDCPPLLSPEERERIRHKREADEAARLANLRKHAPLPDGVHSIGDVLPKIDAK